MRFDGKRVAVTGAAGNLGQAVAVAFYAEGADLVLIDRVPASIGDAGSGAVKSVIMDLTNADETEAAFKALGAVDVLCNIAGGFDMGTPVHEVAAEKWEFMFDINARTMLNSVRGAVPAMIENGGGAIINVGAKAALASPALMGPYTASKSIVIRVTESMAAELKEQGINVNCVLPTALDTPQNREAMPKTDPSRWVEPAALADVILFLASPAARAVHGAAIPVTGLGG
ncbi:MAG: NAD(P)-dependent dehydrogenase (short-subunit alcohol dehydrogenase family) [Gammaproteobacteria bacterium]|jgi:NAD(P)-dependent dehydrogenase (short-subunit alcohol dehydrogenase family)